VLEREGSDSTYPTIAVQAYWGRYNDTTAQWTLGDGRVRIIDPERQVTLAFDSLVHRTLVETPADLLAEPKAPEEMRYAELGQYIDAVERSGGDVRKLKVDQALKIAVPMTCLIIAVFAAPLAITGPRTGAAWGIAVSLGTTILFLTLIQLFRAVGSGGVLPPRLAAWVPNALFGIVGLWLMKRAPT
jgi:lipopolysaccharide export system permease protein